MDAADVVVVGAGPAGLIAAREAAKKGAKVIVLEEHGEVGVPCHCAGLLSLKGLGEIGVPPNADFVQNRVRGAHFFSPSSLSFTVERTEDVACVVDRILFDKFLARQATDAGAEIRLQSKVQRVIKRDGRMMMEEPWGSLAAGVIIDAEGVASRLVKEMDLTPLEPNGVLPALQFELIDVDVDPSYVEMHLGEEIAPKFFAWVIPLSPHRARVGLACRGGDPRQKLEEFVKKRFDEPTRVSVGSGLVITCGPIPKTFSDNFLVVGDAAGHVKPTTGGGVILGGICASIAGGVAAEAVKRGDSSSDFLVEYERLWKERLDREFRAARLARKALNRLSDKTMDKIFRIILEKGLQGELSAKGDMDFQANLLSALAKKGDILRLLLTVAPDILRAP
ncbi:MAG: NAD(P)/FAD-dependent oxidoreductase [Candidatus Bathyarchaeia archaeon]